jgi:2,5-diamino-6-(ribosylamino)-4(3H)-pyrimidinone 5'-phosphate reductase
MNRPYTLINTAMTADGKIDTFERRGSAISSQPDLERVLRLRAESDAVMIGGKTLIGEDPKLIVKRDDLRAGRIAKGWSAEPIKVGVVTRADLKPNSNFLTAGNARKIIFTTEQTGAQTLRNLSAWGVEIYVLGEKRVDLIRALETLHGLGVNRLMVEGGGTLIFELLRLNLVDELIVYVAPLVFGGDSAPTLVDGPGLIRSAAIALKLVDALITDGGGGVLIRYRLSE